MDKSKFKNIIKKKKDRNLIGYYGISFLDDFLGGISCDDLILIGAASGCGKSELAYQIAFLNAKKLKVHLFALEADDDEPYLRTMYKILVAEYFKDYKAGKCKEIEDLRYRRWVDNMIDLDKYLPIAEKSMLNNYPNITVHYRGSGYTIKDFSNTLQTIKNDCDMIIIDHVDYFDYDTSENENTVMTNIMKQLRDLNKFYNIPMVVISHLKKKGNRKQIIPDLDDFIGTSNKHKQVKTAILISKDFENENYATGDYGTFIRIPKGRKGATGNIVARMIFNTRIERYKKKYDLCCIKNWGETVQDIDRDRIPKWAKHVVKESVPYAKPNF